MSHKKFFYLVYKCKAQDLKQVQAIAAEIYDRQGIEPKTILQEHDWDIKKAIDKLKE